MRWLGKFGQGNNWLSFLTAVMLPLIMEREGRNERAGRTAPAVSVKVVAALIT